MIKELVEQLATQHTLDASAMELLLEHAIRDTDTLQYLRNTAVRTAQEQFGRGIYIRGLIELSSYCYRDCLYCGLRRSNSTAERYRLTQEEVLACCEEGYRIGFRTFVLQAGEDRIALFKLLRGGFHRHLLFLSICDWFLFTS